MFVTGTCLVMKSIWIQGFLKGLHGNEGFTISKTMGEMGTGPDSLLNEAELAAAAEEKETHSFEVDPSQVLNVKWK